MVEVLNAQLINKQVIFTCLDVSELNLERLERQRIDNDREVEIIYDTTNKYQLKDLKRFLKSFKANPQTWGDAIQLPVNRTLTLNQYRKFA